MPALQIPMQSGRIILIADLHYDSYWRRGLDPIAAHGLDVLPWAEADAVIVAGDLANNPLQNWRRALSALAAHVDPSKIHVLPGNHDYYFHTIDGDADLATLAQAEGARFLQKSELIHGRTRFLCCTLWSDFDLLGDADRAMLIASRIMNDFSLISMPDPGRALPPGLLTPKATVAIHHDHRRWLDERLAEGFDGRTVIVTHHGPHPEVLGPVDPVTPAFGSDLRDLIRHHRPMEWVFGHTHRRIARTVGATRIRNVGIGYPGERQILDPPPLSDLCVLEPFEG